LFLFLLFVCSLQPLLVQHIRKIWFGLLFADASTRIAELTLPHGLTKAAALFGVTTPGFAFKIARALFEIALLFQVLMGAQRFATETCSTVSAWARSRRDALVCVLSARPSKRTLFTLALLATALLTLSGAMALSPAGRQLAVSSALTRLLSTVRRTPLSSLSSSA
jgi:hypothetical protein